MENIDKIKCVLIDFEQNDKTLDEAANEILRLFSVVGRSEQLVCGCGNPNLTWYGYGDDKTYFCFECKKEVTN
jgi:hypothetical protein